MKIAADLTCSHTKETRVFESCIVGHVNCCLQFGLSLRMTTRDLVSSCYAVVYSLFNASQIDTPHAICHSPPAQVTRHTWHVTRIRGIYSNEHD
ncbi:hypothetical protein PoB_004507600 [Plakobranchus ocellatus]|uniref:Uncharacterized protein n=1 Tax=Plakobranchus ocellatus TaxID=259542 RepID=A0AAV4BI55_9GAST|nr:hypothetical protein PoB_004507600 [Plakobranchus ocellatus]